MKKFVLALLLMGNVTIKPNVFMRFIAKNITEKQFNVWLGSGTLSLVSHPVKVLMNQSKLNRIDKLMKRKYQNRDLKELQSQIFANMSKEDVLSYDANWRSNHETFKTLSRSTKLFLASPELELENLINSDDHDAVKALLEKYSKFDKTEEKSSRGLQGPAD